jgi:hypothetical protein
MTFTRYEDVPLERLNVSATVDLAPPPPRAPSRPPAVSTRDAFAGAKLMSTQPP